MRQSARGQRFWRCPWLRLQLRYEGYIVGEPSSEISFEIVRKKNKRVVFFSAQKIGHRVSERP